jgi:alpha-tubulin suppressor-like RCC1 family protein
MSRFIGRGGRVWRTWAVLGSVVVSLCIGASAGANPTPTSVDHWGAYFGGDSWGQLNTVTPLSLPGDVKQVASSNSNGYALLTNGTVMAWGLGGNGELGNGGTSDALTAPVQVQFPAGVIIKSLPSDTMPFDTGLAVDTHGNVWGWGNNGTDELCSATTNILIPMKLSLPNVSVAAGAGGHAYYDSNGNLYACGVNQDGDLGDGTMYPSLDPLPRAVQLPAGTIVTRVFASYEDGGALTSTGAYYDWGANNNGQVGNGSTASADAPVLVSLPGQVIKATQGGSIDGNGQTIVMLRNNSLWAWGADSSGQLGDGGSVNQLSPIQIHSPAGVFYVRLSCSGWDCYALSKVGTVYAWGQNGWGQIGNGSPRSAKFLTPTPVDSGATLISATANSVVVGTP